MFKQPQNFVIALANLDDIYHQASANLTYMDECKLDATEEWEDLWINHCVYKEDGSVVTMLPQESISCFELVMGYYFYLKYLSSNASDMDSFEQAKQLGSLNALCTEHVTHRELLQKPGPLLPNRLQSIIDDAELAAEKLAYIGLIISAKTYFEIAYYHRKYETDITSESASMLALKTSIEKVELALGLFQGSETASIFENAKNLLHTENLSQFNILLTEGELHSFYQFFYDTASDWGGSAPDSLDASCGYQARM